MAIKVSAHDTAIGFVPALRAIRAPLYIFLETALHLILWFREDGRPTDLYGSLLHDREAWLRETDPPTPAKPLQTPPNPCKPLTVLCPRRKMS
jgi:hypothetical protein